MVRAIAQTRPDELTAMRASQRWVLSNKRIKGGGALGRDDGIAEFEKGVLGASETVISGLTKSLKGV